jgi:hypothetical protein
MAPSFSLAPLQLSWKRRPSGWHKLLNVRLTKGSLAKGGVYVIWAEDASGINKQTIYLGQGKPVADCLQRHRGEKRITKYQKAGRVLRVTWAKVAKDHRGGIEHFLAETLNPLEGERWSDDDPVGVNLPW